MGSTHTSPHEIQPGGSIILRVPGKVEIHFLTPVRLGDGIPAEEIMPELLRIVEGAWGPVEVTEHGEDSDAAGPDWPRWWDWDLHRSSHYTVERRGEERYVGAAGYWEQILIGLMAAAAYDTVKLIAKQVATVVRRLRSDEGNRDTTVEPLEVTQTQLSEHFGAAQPFRIEELPPDDELKRLRVKDANGKGYSVATDPHGNVIWVMLEFNDAAA